MNPLVKFADDLWDLQVHYLGHWIGILWVIFVVGGMFGMGFKTVTGFGKKGER